MQVETEGRRRGPAAAGLRLWGMPDAERRVVGHGRPIGLPSGPLPNGAGRYAAHQWMPSLMHPFVRKARLLMHTHDD